MLGTRPYLLNIERNVEARSFVLWLLYSPCLSVGPGRDFLWPIDGLSLSGVMLLALKKFVRVWN